MRRTTRSTYSVVVLWLALALTMASCSSDGPDLSGTWAGEIHDSVAGTGTLRVTVTQNGENLSGTWAITFPEAGIDAAGSLSGRVDNDGLRLMLTPEEPIFPLSLEVTLTRKGDNRILGTYDAPCPDRIGDGVGCSGAVTGHFEITR
jgi:hypothetical protein